MNDKTRIRILKGMLLVTAGTLAYNTSVIYRLAKHDKRVTKQAKIAGKIINRFVDLTDEETHDKIVEEFEFDWITKDLGD